MNDEEKIIACSGMLHKEMESWSDTSERDFSEEEKLNEIYNLQSIIAGAKAILDDVYAMPDKEKLEAKEKIKETKKIVNKLLHDLKETMHEADQTCVDDFLEPIITDYLKKMKKTLNS